MPLIVYRYGMTSPCNPFPQLLVWKTQRVDPLVPQSRHIIDGEAISVYRVPDADEFDPGRSTCTFVFLGMPLGKQTRIPPLLPGPIQGKVPTRFPVQLAFRMKILD